MPQSNRLIYIVDFRKEADLARVVARYKHKTASKGRFLLEMRAAHQRTPSSRCLLVTAFAQQGHPVSDKRAQKLPMFNSSLSFIIRCPQVGFDHEVLFVSTTLIGPTSGEVFSKPTHVSTAVLCAVAVLIVAGRGAAAKLPSWRTPSTVIAGAPPAQR